MKKVIIAGIILVVIVVMQIRFAVISNAISFANSRVKEVKRLEDEIERLQEIYEYYRELNKEILYLRRENAKLKTIISNKLSMQYKYDMSVAHVAYRDVMGGYRFMIMDGSKVREGAPVIYIDHTNEYLIGKVVRKNENKFVLNTILSPNLYVGVRLENSKEDGVMNGMGNMRCRIDYISKNYDVKPQEEVYVSPKSTAYPGYAKIGHVIKVEESKRQFFKKITIKTHTFFSSISWFYVINKIKTNYIEVTTNTNVMIVSNL